jgi:gamma-glutamylcyclotransferase (GGCT)/AIG2-like uncharacterized protein YtfP
MQMRVFAYGTLRDPKVFARVAGTALPLDRALPAILPGFRRVVLRGTPYPTLLRDPGAETDGLLLAVGALVLRRLHAYEGPAYRFRPVHVTVGSVRIPAHAWISPHADPETDWP